MQGTMKRFDEWYGPYPYAQITVVDPPHGALEAGGMEYPTFITGDTVWWARKARRLSLKVVTEHEFGHQYWYAMVATNEFENAWLDEGINSYTEVKVTDSLYGKNTSVLNWMGAQMGDSELQRMQYLGRAETDSLARPSSPGHEHGIVRGGHLRQDRHHAAVFGGDRRREDAAQGAPCLVHEVSLPAPDPEDFLRTVNEVAGQDLNWYWQQAVYGTQMLDYEVRRADSTPRQLACEGRSRREEGRDRIQLHDIVSSS